MNEFQKPSKLGYSYQDVRAMSDEQIVKAGLDSGDRLAAELANRYDVVCERLQGQTAGSTEFSYVEEMHDGRWQRCALGHVWEKEEDAWKQLEELRRRYGGRAFRLAPKAAEPPLVKHSPECLWPRGHIECTCGAAKSTADYAPDTELTDYPRNEREQP